VKSIRFSKIAQRDFHSALRHFGIVGGSALRAKFAAEIDRAFQRISRYPESGTTKPSRDFDVAGLRATYLARFTTWVVYYTNKRSEIFIIRVLDSRQNIQRDWMDLEDSEDHTAL
jgi:toxin ParE1/3/4